MPAFLALTFKKIINKKRFCYGLSVNDIHCLASWQNRSTSADKLEPCKNETKLRCCSEYRYSSDI